MLAHICISVLRVGDRVEVLQLPLEGLKGRPLDRILVPAFEHDFVELRGASLGGLHPVAVLDLVEDLGVRHA